MKEVNVNGQPVVIVNGKPEGYLSVNEFADKNFVTPAAVRIMICRGRLHPLKIGGRNYFPEGQEYPPLRKRGRKKND